MDPNGIDPPVLLRAEGLGAARGGRTLLHDLSFEICPGLTLVRGGDGRGKTTLLRLLAGAAAPDAGRVRRFARDLWFVEAADPSLDDVVAGDWLSRARPGHPCWSARTAEALVAAFALAPHLGKRLHMLSTGSRRKLVLAGAAACGAAITLLDTPFAALDTASAGVLAEVLAEAAADTRRAWVVADHALPAALAGLTLATVVDLGD